MAEPSLLATDALPNIVILYADDMGYGDLAIQNPESRIPTPHLDQLAREGTRFTDAHSSSGICTPSRYALLTGRYHWRKFHNIVQSFGPSVFDSRELTLPEMLREAGYRTACIGKWHLGWDWAAIRLPDMTPVKGKGYAPNAFDWTRPIPDGPLSHGFDYYFGDDVPNFPPYTWIENDRVLLTPTEPLTITPQTAEGRWEARPGPMVKDWDFYQVMPRLTTRAVQWINEQRDKPGPFFLYFPFTSPHAPIVPIDEFRGRSGAGGYGDFMVQTDWTVGEVLRALERNGFADNTLVIFTSDNGPEYYAFERIRNFHHRSMGPLRGIKRDIWEGGHRVPFVVRWPGRVPAGRVSDALMGQIDIFATLAAIVGYDIPATAADDSRNLLAEWAGNHRGPPIRDSMVHNTFAGQFAIRAGEWVLIDAPSGGKRKVPAWFDERFGYTPNPYPGELYRIHEDISEHNNLFGEFPDKVAELRQLLEATRARGEVRPGYEGG